MVTSVSGPVILLSIDTLRLDRFTSEFFPESMPILESDFANFTNAYSHGTATPFAFPGVITGHQATGDGRFPNTAPTIAELFDGPTSGFSNNAHLRPERGYNRGFSDFDDQHPPDWSPSGIGRVKSSDQLRESKVVTTAYRFAKRVANLRGGDSSGFSQRTWSADRVAEFVSRRLAADDAFVWGHFMDSHKPFTPASGIDVPAIDRSDEEIRWLNSYEHERDPLGPDDMALLESLYNSNVRYVDRELGRLLSDLRTKRWYDDAMIVVVGDHGELFGEHGYMFHPGDIDPPNELIETPLLIKYPGGEDAGTSYGHLVQHGDIIATIAATVGLNQDRLPDNVHPLRCSTERHVITAVNTAIRVTEGDSVAIRRRDGTDKGLQTISSAGRRALMDAVFPSVKNNAGEVKGVQDIQRQDQLEALGYR